MKFEKVTYSEFNSTISDLIPNHDLVESEITEMYEAIKLPRRATSQSAGYDFYLPYTIIVDPGRNALIPTGIKAKLDADKVLEIYPRSGLGFKYGMGLRNTVGIIDADYYDNENNEGHIMIKIVNNGNRAISLQAGAAFAQGIIKQYFVVEDDAPATVVRTGGMGSTDGK